MRSAYKPRLMASRALTPRRALSTLPGLRAAIPLAALLCGASTSAADDPEPGSARSTALAETSLAETGPRIDPPLVSEFAPFIGPRPDLNVPPTAVDLSEIEPPIEDPVLRTLGTGVASFYGRRFHGRRTANGERFDMNAMTAAHKTLPFGTKVRVTNPRNGRSVVVRINDRGPFTRGRTIDLSRAAAREIGMIARGHARVELDILR
ncbi:septal ring lytic transglycosylase RlpA family protein [Erythrobacter rubeus]|uniref:Endolytic peptidoglycan transglycosylase RlpA n=1 Tax=Erythrobacter rubeus TaxID=2760803 RepID=A0ABR8KLY2_9SPHN|nr:septal ring lytic transglycosylase RlpA family protein [Erythrobacter rubeus]MBD2841476.1 septal ring lytic transglycosylase RlpA family protein [Erythrobacter rubeus]